MEATASRTRALLVLGVVALVGGLSCGSPLVTPPSPPAEPSWPSTARSSSPAAPLVAAAMPGPGRRGGSAAVLQNQACEGCHSDVAAEWRGSMHRGAHDNLAYQKAFAIEPMPFCTRCHAPES